MNNNTERIYEVLKTGRQEQGVKEPHIRKQESTTSQKGAQDRRDIAVKQNEILKKNKAVLKKPSEVNEERRKKEAKMKESNVRRGKKGQNRVKKAKKKKGRRNNRIYACNRHKRDWQDSSGGVTFYV